MSVRKLAGKKVSIIVCSYNNKSVIADALNSIKAQSFRDYECFVIDDCSTDGTPELVKKRFPWAKVIKKPKQSGPSISRNLGVRTSSVVNNSEFIMFMDSDVVLEKNWLSKQIKLFRKLSPESRIESSASGGSRQPKPGIIGCKLLYKSNHSMINSAGGSLTTSGIGYDIGRHKSAKLKEYNTQKKVIYVCSAAMLASRKMLDEIGVFDNTFFYGHEDTDLGWRANVAGYEAIYNPRAVAYHNVSESMQHQSKTLYYYATKNRIRTLIKNYEWYNIWRFLPLLLMLVLGDIVFRNFKLVKIKAVWWNIANLGSTLRERKKVQRTRKVPDKEIMKMIESSQRLFKQSC